MDPNPTKFPILSYVMSKLPSRNNNHHSPEFDIEQPPPSSSENDDKPYFEITERMPYLNDPDLIASMRATVADVSRTRSVLKTLGDCPDHELVDIARSKLAEMEKKRDYDVAGDKDRLDDVALNVDDDVAVNVDIARSKLSEMEKDRVADVAGGKVDDDVAKERSVFEAVVKVYEMHERYEKMLTEAERKLEKLYNEAKRGGRGKGVVGSGEEGSSRGLDVDEGVTEEVVGILNEALASNAERVDLSEKRLPVLPEAFGKLKMLVSLKLSSNQLEVLPDSIAGLENLEEFFVSSNLLESLPDSIGLLLKLKILDVSSNKLTSLPDSICHCRSLVELDASFNKLTYIPTKIGYELENLKKFSVHLNKIRSLPTSIGEMTSLQVLDVHFNELGVVPPSIGRLSNLEILNLSGNFSDLTSLPFTIGDLTNLKELDISNNQIRELPVTFGRLENLKKLNLGENPLVIPPKEVVDEGVESVKEFMAKRLLDALIEEEEKSKVVENKEQAQDGGWLTRSTSWLTNAVAGAAGTVGGYLATKKDTTNEDPYLNQQL